ncbi:MAG: MarR family winged helix-turn-helix transcriptional regulator [Myxococcales bacterium]|nr:MarR family winged helix-turn-helix transcriptional regulator [Myxococcales bacterium]
MADHIERIASLLRAESRTHAAELGLHPVQLDALAYLASCNRYSDTPAAVAEFLGATRGTVSQTVSALVRKGLVHKRKDSVDGRVVHCELTAAGRQALRDRPSGPVHGALRALRTSDAEQLMQLLTSVLRRAQQVSGGRTFGQCATCRFLQRTPAGLHCGVTEEPLSEGDTQLLCREHQEEDGDPQRSW